ncbi:MAG: tRNA uridine-5-carboxymethylaminomethyl(34) synthesis GTPase MnmE [Armatimonadetes bacterium]|nr:tRNA uridine-5-carboxymethylaminomethyl(34) synthesis GTPase MnmE [Armatimonadota bacterium]
MRSLSDTIVAPITALGGAVALVRISGPRALDVAQAVANAASPSGSAQVKRVRYTTNDDGLATFFPDGKSFTGEPTVELSCHGSQASVEALVSVCIESGARPAEPGEFSYRAFMNGKMDLSQAEGVRDTVAAQTELQLKQANLMRDGKFRNEVRIVRETCIAQLAAIDASTDFSEEIGEVDLPKASSELCLAEARLKALLSSVESARAIRDGVTVAIVGRPNVGKSSLLNAVSGRDRAIVTDIPGTTRDTLEEVVNVHGVVVRFIDTAGLREALDMVERLGVERSFEALENAHHVWFVYDSSTGWTPEDEALCRAIQGSATYIANKIDLDSTSIDLKEGAIPVSAVTGAGIADLLLALVPFTEGSEVPLPNQRQAPLLARALEAVTAAKETFCGPIPTAVAATELMAAIRILGEITGETASPDMIERVFHDFCIGK